MRESPTFIAIDTETTGLEKKDELIEVAGVKFKIVISADGRIVPETIDSWSSLIKPGQMIPESATRINKITNEMVEQAPSAADALQEFTQFCGLGAILIAHNASFDCGFLGRAIVQNQLRSLNNPVIDSLKLSRKIHPEYVSHRLNSLARQLSRAGKMEYHLESENLHRALYDCEVLTHVFVALVSEILKPEELSSRQLITVLERYHGPFLSVRAV